MERIKRAYKVSFIYFIEKSYFNIREYQNILKSCLNWYSNVRKFSEKSEINFNANSQESFEEIKDLEIRD
ncbi:hypothetical protein THC_1412 [Caldimicrobium thiodismutans]|uniref:Uncharacterized protein n=1 Tax=Caldimicrobium thiodismutans TaxID=1653476 RepID=A0A0U5APE0_9BACT|nr:hypothetical protein THC_1412 [Caldimicrobium thiodismutans]